MTKEIYICVATQKNNPEDTIIWNSIKTFIDMGVVKHYKFFLNNTYGLATVYNRVLRDEFVKDKIVVFVHDDVLIDDLFFAERLNYAFEEIDKNTAVVAIAGNNGFEVEDPETPMLWHLMCKREQLKGEVSTYYYNFDGNVFCPYMSTVFGPVGRLFMADGVFLAVDVERLNGVEFDEKCPSKFHFYDLNFCLNCYAKNVLIMSYPIRIVHKSPGLVKFSDDWRVGDAYFRKKYVEITGHKNNIE